MKNLKINESLIIGVDFSNDIDHAKNFNKEFGVYVEKENNYAENQ